MPLLTTVLVTSTKKWTQVGKEAEEDGGVGVAPDAEDEAAAAAFEAVAELAEEAQEEVFVERPRRAKKAPERLIEEPESDEDGEVEGEGEEEESDEMEQDDVDAQLAGDKQFAAEERPKNCEV